MSFLGKSVCASLTKYRVRSVPDNSAPEFFTYGSRFCWEVEPES